MSIELLLKAILDDPSDISRRLVYADALQEQGNPRSEFIAHHIAGNAEADLLLKKHAKEWIAFLRPAVSHAGLRFVNGFVERITLQVKYLDRLPGFLEVEPIHEVRFRDLSSVSPRLAAMPECTRRITWLDLKHAHVSGRGFASLMDGRWDRLWRIWAPSNGLGDVGVKALVAASLPNLKSLNLYGARLRDASLERLTTWRGLAKIEELNLCSNDLSDDAIAALLAAAPRLRWVGLHWVGPTTLEVLGGRPSRAIQMLVVGEARSTFTALKRLYGKRLVRPSDYYYWKYPGSFDLSWP